MEEDQLKQQIFLGQYLAYFFPTSAHYSYYYYYYAIVIIISYWYCCCCCYYLVCSCQRLKTIINPEDFNVFSIHLYPRAKVKCWWDTIYFNLHKMHTKPLKRLLKKPPKLLCKGKNSISSWKCLKKQDLSGCGPHWFNRWKEVKWLKAWWEHREISSASEKENW